MRAASIRKMTKKKLAQRPAYKVGGKAKDWLAVNLTEWLKQPDAKTVAQIAEKSGVAPKTIYNMKKGVYDPCGITEEVARVFEKEAWMLLCPATLKEIAEIIHVYSRADDRGRRDIETALRIVKEDMGEDQ